MAALVEIRTESGNEADAGHSVIIERVCAECSLGYEDDLYAGILLTDNEGIRGYNHEFRGIDSPTDVLSFPLLSAVNGDIEYNEVDMDPATGAVMLGDIIISVERTREQAAEYGHSFERELAFLTCHGMLHLLGYDHMSEDDEEIMTGRQEAVLGKLGYRKQEI